jgi:molybdenum-dependent DNA-binding transcriptional regulator ModE
MAGSMMALVLFIHLMTLDEGGIRGVPGRFAPTIQEGFFHEHHIASSGCGLQPGNAITISIVQPCFSGSRCAIPKSSTVNHRNLDNRMMLLRCTLIQLRAFCAVAREGSFGAAARRLGMTQSGVSQAVIGLENVLGVTLFSRTQEGVVPTLVASRLLHEAENALGSVMRLQEIAAMAKDDETGQLRIACVPSVAARLMPRWLKSFALLHPAMETMVYVRHHIEAGDWVLQGIADIGFTSVTHTGLAAKAVFQDELKLVAHRGHSILSRGASVPIGDFAGIGASA